MVPRIDASGCSSWATPRADQSAGSKAAEWVPGKKPTLHGKPITTSLTDQAKLWPSATAGDSRSSGGRDAVETGRTHPGTSLTDAAKLWPTATMPYGSSCGGGDSRDQRGWSRKGENRPSLDTLAKIWGTPRATDGEKGGPNMSFGAGGEPLPSQANKWATPASRDGKGAPKDGFCMASLPRDASLFSLPAQTTSTGGGGCSTDGRNSPRPAPRHALESWLRRGDFTDYAGLAAIVESAGYSVGRRLNALFVEHLMGWPITWTELTGSEPVEMAWYLSRQRSLLSSLLGERE
uniref:Uncharacterized protein n=1 Tax=viral metagenome TaxID=1070528 RepID=A0A6H1ZDZ7_9ZZZZ